MTNRIVIPHDMEEMPLWGRREVMRLLPYRSPSHFDWLEKNDKFPRSFKVGGKRFWRPEVVTTFIDEAMAKAEAKTAA